MVFSVALSGSDVLLQNDGGSSLSAIVNGAGVVLPSQSSMFVSSPVIVGSGNVAFVVPGVDVVVQPLFFLGLLLLLFVLMKLFLVVVRRVVERYRASTLIVQ